MEALTEFTIWIVALTCGFVITQFGLLVLKDVLGFEQEAGNRHAVFVAEVLLLCVLLLFYFGSR